MAPDCKLYIAQNSLVSGNWVMAVINNPNAAGVASNVVAGTINLGSSRGEWGLPNLYEMSCNMFPITDTTINETICQGDSVVINGNVYKTPGVFFDTLFNGSVSGCDSMITTNLIVNSCAGLTASFTPSATTICEGDSITFTDNSIGAITSWNWTFNGGTPATATTQGPHTIGFNTAGTYNITLQVGDGSITDDTTIAVLVNAAQSTTQTFTECQGFSTTVGANTYATTGVFIDTLVAASGCDSIVTTNLTINPLGTSTTSVTICQGDSLLVGGVWQTIAGAYNDTLTGASINGCDSIITTNLTINSAATGIDVITSCTPITWLDGNTYAASTTTPIDTIVGGAASGCDSIVTLNLTITTPSTTTNVLNECAGFSVTVGSNTYTTTGIYTDINGCDTTITDLTIIPSPQITLIKADDNCGEEIGSVTAIATSNNPPITYNWNTGSADSIISNLPIGTYSISITDSTGCISVDTAEVLDLQIDCDFFVYLPNAFTPNGDGNNDVLYVRGKGIEAMTFSIYNRWGNKVFETTDMAQGWDGTYKGKEQNTGVFVYVIEGTFLNNKTFKESGDVGLIR